MRFAARGALDAVRMRFAARGALDAVRMRFAARGALVQGEISGSRSRSPTMSSRRSTAGVPATIARRPP